MNIICPENYIRREKKDFVHCSDICWNNKSKSWELPEKYGSYQIIKSVKERVYYPLDKRIQELISNIRKSPYGTTMGRSAGRSKAMKFSYILWLAGVQEIIIGNNNYLSSYKQEPENVLLEQLSFCCYPGVTFPFTNGRPFLHWLLEYYNMSFSGGAGESYMQASFNDKEFITEVVLYFQALKYQFRDSITFYKNKG